MPLFFLDRSIHLLPYALTYDQTVMQHYNIIHIMKHFAMWRVYYMSHLPK
jgi:hypothetical protein